MGQPFSGLVTDDEHDIFVRREAIPLVFVPGIMGSRLRRAGTNGKGKGADGLPNLRWDPGSGGWMWWNYSGKDGGYRKRMLVGPSFKASYLEVDNDNPVGDGFSGVMEDYWKKFLKDLKKRDWGPLAKIFEFPVYAFGYNWTDSNENSGKKLAARIKEIISEAKQVTGLCEKVILITHSMGGLVARWASEEAGAKGQILGIIHGVQPATGAPAAYWRMKGGFEGGAVTSRVLGKNATEVTPVLGNLPGGLQLLPTHNHVATSVTKPWLTVTQNGKAILSLPGSSPYSEIYRVRAVVKPAKGAKPSNNNYWGLVDPELLDPENSNAQSSHTGGTGKNNLDADANVCRDNWGQYLSMLNIAETFHQKLGKKKHAETLNFWGTGHNTADVIELRIRPANSGETKSQEPYPDRGFRGFFTGASGNLMVAEMQNPAGGGDGTVPISSASALKSAGKTVPAETGLKVEHQPAFEDGKAQDFTVKAIIALCQKRYQSQRGST